MGPRGCNAHHPDTPTPAHTNPHTHAPLQVFVADPNTGNILNFNVGDNVDLRVPRVNGGRGWLACWSAGWLRGVAGEEGTAPRPLPLPTRPPRATQTFWSRLAGRFGTKFFWQEQGQDAAIVNAVAAIDNCVREPMGRLQCASIRGELE